MINFHELCHVKLFRNIGEILELKKLDFRGFKVQFDAKKANFMGLIAKNGQLRPNLACRTYMRYMLMTYAIEIVP